MAVGRQLKKMSREGQSLTFKYDHNGMRIQKVLEHDWYPETTNYTYHGKLLTHMEVNYTDFDEVSHVDKLHFFYDASGCAAKVQVNGAMYSYIHNLQGDIVGILDNAGNLVVEYKYDAWGKLLSTTGSLADTLGIRNPFRYRGYVYDEETGYYYVSFRYYNDSWGRWVVADLSETIDVEPENLTQYNLFVYCFNSPVNMADDSGLWPNWVKKAIAVVAVAVTVVAATAITVATFGAGSVAGVAMITASATIAARATEVTILQVKKGKEEGQSADLIAKNCVEAIYDNGAKIIGTTPVTKTVGIFANHALNVQVAKIFDDTQKLSETLK